MAKKNVKVEHDELENVNEALSRSERWIEENQKVLTIAVSVIVVIILGVMAVNQWVIKPKAEEAHNDNAKAEAYFSQAMQLSMSGNEQGAADLYKKALEGDDAECVGFLEVADSYHNQPAKLAALYAGICYAELGQWDEAKEYLSKFDASDETIAPAAQMRLGDVYVELGELDKAAKAFEHAAKSDNDIVAPIALMKAGRVYLKLEDKHAAEAVFQQVKTLYPASQDAQEADKYLQMCAE